MATKKRAPKLNREQRRGETFDHPVRPVPSPWTSDDIGAKEAIAGRPDQDQTRQTGPGTGGATEEAGRIPHHEGMHGANSTKG